MPDQDDGGENPVTGPETPGAARDGNPASNVHALPPRDGAPLADKAEEMETEEEADGQVAFVVHEGIEKVSLGSLVKRGTPVKTEFKMTGKAVPNVKGGMIDPYASSVLLLADCVVSSYRPTYIRDGDGKVESVTVYMELKPRYVADALSEQGQTWLRENAKAAGAA